MTCDLALDELWETQAEAQGGAKASALATHRLSASLPCESQPEID